MMRLGGKDLQAFVQASQAYACDQVVASHEISPHRLAFTPSTNCSACCMHACGAVDSIWPLGLMCCPRND